MMDIELELNKLLDKYSLMPRESSLLAYLQNKLLTVIPAGKKVAIRCSGDHTEELLKLMNGNREIVGVFDQDPSPMGKYAFEVLAAKDLADYSFDYLIISTFLYRNEIKQELKEQFPTPSFQVIDLYDLLEADGIVLTKAFYYNVQYPYLEIIRLKNELWQTHTAEEKTELLLQMICLNLKTRDFVSALHNIELMKEYSNACYTKLQAFKAELLLFFDEMKLQLSKRKTKDIVIVWNDQIPFHELSSLPYLAAIQKDCLSFTNAFTTSPNTSTTFASMFSKQLPIDDFGKAGSGCVIEALQNEGYQFNYFGVKKFTTEDMDKEKYPFELTNVYADSAVRYFRALRYLLLSKEKVCVVVHEVAETHVPYVSPDLSGDIISEFSRFRDDFTSPKLLKQKEISRNFWSKQIEFYDSLLSCDCTRIYLSDHGTWHTFEQSRYKDAANHVFLLVKGPEIAPASTSKLFSLYNFLELLAYIIHPDEAHFEAMFAKTIRLQEPDIYSKKILRYISPSLKTFAMSYRAVRSENDKYILFRDGQELYYLLPDETTNLIADSHYQGRINELRLLCKDNFIDISKEKKYEAAREFFEHCS